MLMVTGSFGSGTIPGLLAVLCFAAIIAYLIRSNEKTSAIEFKEAV